MATLAEINIYPVKSLQGISVKSAELTEQGLKWDRFWMVVNEDGLFVTQRNVPTMAKITTFLTDEHLILSHPEMSEILVPLVYSKNRQRDARVWKSECQVLDEGQAVSDWLTAALGEWRGQKLSLVRMAQTFERLVSDNHTNGAKNTTYFADGYPVLVTTYASLSSLNKTLESKGETPVPMSRFRSNLVVEGHEPAFVEHNSERLVLEPDLSVAISLCKPCERCKMTSIDQKSGLSDSPQQPLKTLMSMDHVPKKGAFFGQNGVICEESKVNLPVVIKVGDPVAFL